MRVLIIASISLSLCLQGFGQKKSLISPIKPKPDRTETQDLNASDEDKVKKVIDDLFDAMRTSDGPLVSQLFESTATLSSVFVDQNGQTQYRTNPSSTFVEAIGKPKTDLWDEKIWEYNIRIDGPLAKAWTPYTFYLNKQLSHCGTNDFEFVKRNGQWKISRIIDTRRKTDCIQDPQIEINNLVDNWHKAAATANEQVFFGSMMKDAIYIGTDASERWTTMELKEWSKEYFKRESAWSFTPTSRNLSVDESGELAWFDELLDTWMGPCRSTGIVRKVNGKWKIAYYHLSIAVPNETVNDYIKLIQSRSLFRSK